MCHDSEQECEDGATLLEGASETAVDANADATREEVPDGADPDAVQDVDAIPGEYARDQSVADAQEMPGENIEFEPQAEDAACEPLPTLGDTLSAFDRALNQFHDALSRDSLLEEAVFGGTEEWRALLTYKLVPHLSGEGALVAAVAGGTNTGKSTVFNLLLGEDTSPVRNTAAATCRPVLAANLRRHDECLDRKLLPEFLPQSLHDPEAVIAGHVPPETLFVACNAGLPDSLVLLDTPDVDSIDKQNWKVADNIQAAGDVLIAVLTGEKYKDDRVVEFFRHAREAGRIILPLMNKANPENDYEVARIQLQDFCNDVGLDWGETVCFVIPHDFSLAKQFGGHTITSLDTEHTLRDYLGAFDVTAVKERVYRNTVAYFVVRSGAFLGTIEAVAGELRQVLTEFEDRAATYSTKYDPVPGVAIGGLFHEFVQSKRGRVDQAIGATSRAFVHGVSTVSRTVMDAIAKRVTLEKPEADPSQTEIEQQHQESLERLTRELATSYFESARNLREPAGHLVLARLEALEVDEAVAAVVAQAQRAESVSDEFRAHAQRLLDEWWYDHRGKRLAVEALDKILLVMPAAIAAPIAMYTGGVGAPEAIIVAGPFIEQFVARVIEYQFGDAMFDFLSPWRAEQWNAFERALLERVTHPALGALEEALEPFENENMTKLRRWHDQCLKAS